jgi:pilus assembly protein Flp/PilA
MVIAKPDRRNFILEGNVMLKTFVRLREGAIRLVTNESGVVSFEYVIVAACVVAAVLAAFGTGTGTGIGAALKAGIDSIVAKLPA